MASPKPRNDDLRIALVGCGVVCEHKHLPALRRVTGAHVVALVDTDTVRCARVADRFGVDRRLEDVHQLIATGMADIVGVLVPPSEHARVAIAALEAGAHVLVEKPVALSLADADALIEAERRSKGRVVMGHHMRWHRLVREAVAVVRQGRLGRLESIQASWYSPRGDEDTPLWMERRATGGGALVELGVHLADLWRHLPASEVADVHAWVRHGNRDDAAAKVTARTTDGILLSASLSEGTSHAIEIEVCGSGGRVVVGCQRFDGFAMYARHESSGMPGPRLRGLGRMLKELPRGLAGMRRLGDYGDSFRGMWQHVVNVARGTAEPECTLTDGRAALAIVIAASASAESGRPVGVADAPGQLVPATPRGQRC